MPSRLHQGKFYALPQAPQQFKQLIMVAGFDRYFQIAPCFRDEDPRADRSPGEFYQLDLEMSFVDQDDVLRHMEPVIRQIFEDFGDGRPVTREFRSIPFAEAMAKYGTDKPDLRNPIEMQMCPSISPDRASRIFASILEKPGTEIRAIPAPKGGRRKFCDRMNKCAHRMQGLPGMGYIFWREARGWHRKPPALWPRTSGRNAPKPMRAQLGSRRGDAAFFLGGKPELHRRRRAGANVIADELGYPTRTVRALLDRRFPDVRVGRRGEEDRLLPQPVLDAQGRHGGAGDRRPAEPTAYQYDVVCNGYELGSGAIRNHKPDVMVKAFGIAGYPPEDRSRSSSAACSTPSDTARRPMAAWRSAWSAS